MIQAINEYSMKYGEPPRDLNSLVPEYLPHIPNTGIGAYPEYKYSSDPAARDHSDNEGWSILVDTPSAILNFDIFIYWPNQDYAYAEREFTARAERIEDWAYIHD